MLDKAYDSKKYENDIYKQWEDSGCFTPEVNPDLEPFTISIPPPNATGTLHLGHAVMLALEDIMIRYKRMRGYNALWVPGTDHAAIATQSVVEKKLQNEGIKQPRIELGREKLLNEIKAFVEDSKSTIRNQVKKMGSSCDWTREKYTLDDDLNHAVNTFFGNLYEDGLMYHGDRIVNWDPKMQTTVADDELERVEEKAPFYTFQYGPFQISTARPETKFGDKYVVMHPDDERYKEYKHGDTFECEWINGKITSVIIKDEAVDPEFGTGVMTITPWHDATDFEIGQRHDLDAVQVIDFEGKILAIGGEFEGMHIEEARSKIVEKLDQKGLLVSVDEEYVHNKAVNYRGKGTIEPQIMKQWFIDVNKQAIDWKGQKMSIKEVMQDVVRSQMVRIIPDRFEKTYFHWIDNLRDWCVSRQIWWGHQIPVWYKVSAEHKAEWEKHPESSSYLLQSLGVEILETKFGETEPTEEGPWIRDPDTLDTWFSSALWTFSTLGWPEHTDEFKHFHPTSVLETGYDILFFWVARMILASTYCLRKDGLPEEQCIPFKDVYLHGLVRDREGKKMSKSRPETCIDPLDMIEKYGADALRLSLVIGGTPGNDMRLYEEKIAGYRNFVNKVWNATRFALMNLETISKEEPKPELNSTADKWICSKLQTLIEDTTKKLDEYNFSEAGQNIYDFLWHEFCDYYLEISKEDKNEPVIQYVLETLLKLLHPFIPFVTEALWQEMGKAEMMALQKWPEVQTDLQDAKAEANQELVNDVIKKIRNIRAESKVEPKKEISATIYAGEHVATLESSEHVIKKFCKVAELSVQASGEKIDQAAYAAESGIEIYVPLAGMIDMDKEKERLQKELENVSKYVAIQEKKLSNENFVSNAPAAVVDGEKQKLAEAQEKMKQFEEQLAGM